MSVVRTNGDDGVVAEFGVVANAVEEAGELFVHGVKDAVVEGAPVAAPFVERWPLRTVNIVWPKVDEERIFLLLRLVDKFEGGIDKSGGDL